MSLIKLIIAGGRDFTDYQALFTAMIPYEEIRVEDIIIISGTAKGADQLGEQYARDFGLKCERMPADWKPNGVFDRGAGHKRNALMADCATHLLAFWDGLSKGTEGMINVARKKGLNVTVVMYNQEK